MLPSFAGDHVVDGTLGNPKLDRKCSLCIATLCIQFTYLNYLTVGQFRVCVPLPMWSPLRMGMRAVALTFRRPSTFSHILHVLNLRSWTQVGRVYALRVIPSWARMQNVEAIKYGAECQLKTVTVSPDASPALGVKTPVAIFIQPACPRPAIFGPLSVDLRPEAFGKWWGSILIRHLISKQMGVTPRGVTSTAGAF